MSAARTIVAAATCIALLAAGCGDEPASRPATHKRTGTVAKTQPPPARPAPRRPAIEVTSPKEFAVLVRAMVLSGSASVPEGDLAWELRGADGSPLASGVTVARCGAPCRGRFRAPVSLASVPLGSWELRVWAPNTDEDGGRLHEVMVPVTVAAQRVPGAPDPDAPPPGMPPQG